MKFPIIYIILLMFIPFSAISSTEKLTEEYSQAITKLEEAVDQRNFSEAKNVLLELMPIMKAELKSSKKELAAMKSELEESELEMLKNINDRKKEIYDRLQRLINVSSAALRGRSADMIKLVEEFGKLTS
ncbi:hypothetical protein [Ekhidna sp.]